MHAQQIDHSFSFDPRYGFDESALRAFTFDDAEPEGFAGFWEGIREKAMAVPMNAEMTEEACPWPGLRLFRCAYTVWPDYRAGAWILAPAGGAQPELGVVVGHGYGGRQAPEPGRAGPDRVTVFPVAPGFDISRDARLPYNDCMKHVVHGIERPETYVLASCAAAFWRGPDLLEFFCGGRLERNHYIGWSFGGGMGALMLPWETRYASAELGQVTFAHQPFRVRHDCNGSGAAVRRRWLEDPAIEETLRIYDAAFSLRRVRIPVAFACACFDPCVHPPGQWAAANGHPGPKIISAYPTGHFECAPPEQAVADAAHQRRVTEFFGFPGQRAGC